MRWCPWRRHPPSVEDSLRRISRLLQFTSERVTRMTADFTDIEGQIAALSTALSGIITEVNDLIARLPVAGAITEAEVQQIKTDLAAAVSQAQAVTPEPPAS